MRGLLAAVIVMGVAGCSPVSVLNALAPRAGIAVTHDVPYAPGPRQTLDIYAPDHDAKTADQAAGAPVVVFIYGGGWKDGDKSMYRFVAATLAARGFLTVVPDYRLFPQVRFPVFIQDAAAAVAWTRANISRYGGDPHRLFLMGHSAGAHIAAMLTLDKQWLRADGLDPDRDIAGMVGLAGPYDFLPLHDPELEDIFAPAGDLRLTQPITFARGDAPPMFLAAGTDDTTVRPSNTEHLAAAIRRDGGRVEEKLYPGIGHPMILGAIAGPLRWFAPVLRDVTAFLDQHDGRALVLGTAPADELAKTGKGRGARPMGGVAGIRGLVP
ncbi:alpha/beta hydrolase [Rhodopila sp.]|uniref:alpha/beta hydrolase n=1 Tax=Rhodopila sp. TaxID=2480087 RepID=UPI003D095F91